MSLLITMLFALVSVILFSVGICTAFLHLLSNTQNAMVLGSSACCAAIAMMESNTKRTTR